MVNRYSVKRNNILKSRSNKKIKKGYSNHRKCTVGIRQKKGEVSMVEKNTKKLNSSFEENIRYMNEILPVKESFDIIRREIIIGGKASVFYYIDGFIKDEAMLKIMDSFLSVSEQDMPKDAEMFIQKHVPYVEVEILEDFEQDKYNVLCNSMLLTEGWDCPSVDCIVVLRPTKVRSLYCQMVGRGTRLSPETGKDQLLLLDFLWHTERHELCHPAHLICESEEVAKKMTENLEKDAGYVMDIEEAEKAAAEDVVAQREEALAKQLDEMKKRKRKLVDPLQFEMSIQAEDLAGYVPAFGWEMAPPSDKQKSALEKLGILPDEIENAGKAAKILDRLDKRKQAKLTTPRQIRFLENRGFQHVGTWQFETAKKLIDRIAGNGWRIPADIRPSEYKGA